ncbi:MAG: hypothetical protein K8R77_11280 [Anaerolineaceae bacterium]|nr:hypothetical protein [Anaerolineaceae bacterium]
MNHQHKHISNRSRSILLAASMLLALGCGFLKTLFPGTTDPISSPSPSDPIQEGNTVTSINGAQTAEGAFYIRLSEGQQQPQAFEPLPLATGEPLTEEEIAVILDRLAELPPATELQTDLKLPEELLPPPRPGETIGQPFPPRPEDIGPETVESGPLEVLRFSPEGEIPMAPFINITFNQPMAALGTLAQLAEQDVPVQIEPALEGTWRWLGTKTLNFQYDSDLIDRLPMATEFRVTVPAGTTSATGGVLAESVSWTFNTPAPILTSYHPSYGPQPLEPVLFAAFDQRINPPAVLETIRVLVNGEPYSIRLATADEIKADSRVKYLSENTSEDRWLAFKTDKILPKDADIQVLIGPETPSAEGALVTTQTQSFSFETYPPLRIEEYGCSWYGDNCPPLTPFYIRFNNPIDSEKFIDSMISIDPDLAGAVLSVSGNTLTIQGASEGRTTYRVTVDEAITDIFGQQFGKDETLKIKVGKAEPVLIGPQRTLVTIDPAAAKPELSLYTINYNKLAVKIYAVEPKDWQAFKLYLQDYARTDQPPQPPGKLVLDDTLKFQNPADALSEVKIDLSQVMDGSYGHFIVIVKPPKGFFEEERYWETVQTWVQVTQIGLDAFADQADMVAWATNLADGSPLNNVTIQSTNNNVKAVTGEDGIARFKLPNSGISVLTAQKGDDVVMLPRSESYWGEDTWSPQNIRDSLRWYVFDDRAMYRPGEEIHVKGWMRRIGGTQTGDVELIKESVTQVNYQFIDPQGNELAQGSAEVNALGGFDLAFTIPENSNLGYAQLSLSAIGSISNVDNVQYYHNFQIQEFRRPEFEVTARNETTGPYFVDGDAIVAVEAAYYAGGALPGADVTWSVTATPTNYQPPNWSDFSFGTWTPWWYNFGPVIEAYYGDWENDSSASSQIFEGKTDASGNHYLGMDFEGTGDLRPQSVIAEAVVMDVNRQAWAGSTSLLVHPADLYVGLRSERYFVERGQPLDIELIVTDLDGNPVIDRPVQVTAERIIWKTVKGRWQEVAEEPQTCTVGSQKEPVSCSFETPLGGKYRITALITDEMGRQNQSQFTRWVSGGELPPARKVEQEQVTLIPDQETYQPGDTARLLVQSPFSPAEGLLTVSRSGILYTERFQITDGSATLEIPIEEAHIPNLNVQVDLTGAAARTDDEGQALPDVPDRPAFASGSLNLNIPPLSRTLTLTAAPRLTALEPGGRTRIDLQLQDASGEPVSGAELAVVVVDEAILALTGYQLADPLATFYYTRSANVSSTYGRSSIILIDPQTLAQETQQQVAATQVMGKNLSEDSAGMERLEMEMPMAAAPAVEEMAMDAAGEGGEAPDQAAPIAVRSDFNPLAVFAPEVRTNASGEASVAVKLPDNLTRYRVMVVAVDDSGKQFGTAEASLTARLPLLVRPSVSRFLNFGDQFELPVVLQNQTDEDMTVEVVAEASNLNLAGSAGMRVTVPANNRVEVRFPGTTNTAGTASVQFAAVTDGAAGAAQVSLPVYTPATTEAFATYGVLDSGAVLQPIAAPEGVFPQYGGLEITTSSTALQALTDAVLYLVSYPFDCSEQLASRILGVSALRTVLSAFEADGLPSPEAMEASVIRDIEELRGLQNWDGGFPYWRRGYDSIPYNTVHVAHALQRARMMDFAVPEDMWQSSLEYLRYVENYYPSWYSLKTRQTISAYALYVRMRMGDSDPNKAQALIDDAGGPQNLPLDAVAWVWQVLQDTPGAEQSLNAIRQHVNNQAVETAGAANFFNGYSDDDYVLLHSNRRTDALLMDALIGDSPQSDLTPKLVNGLLSHRTRGRWGNTQENVFVLLALDRYFKTFEAQEPDFVARIWLGNTYAGSSTFEGYTTDRYLTEIPMSYLMDATAGKDTEDLILSKDGAGRLYYRLGLRYAPTNLRLDPLDMGFVVQRVYEGVDDPDDVKLDEQGVWHIKAGARVRVRLTMVADNRRYHVALVDPLPAGLEIINPALAVAESIPADPNSAEPGYWWWWRWYQHQNMRDERAEVFTALLWDGVYEYTYVARATMPGEFVAPPAKAEEMYSPEVFGRSGSDIVVVE